MKKFISLMAIMSFTFIGLAQTKERKTIVEGVSVDFQIQQVITDETDTLVYFYYGFQNKEYTYITDIGSFFFTEKEDMQKFIDALLTLSEKEGKVNVDISLGSKGHLQIYDFAPKVIYLNDSKGKYTTMTKSKAKSFALEMQKYIDLLQ
jgi:hypothetical protein